MKGVISVGAIGALLRQGKHNEILWEVKVEDFDCLNCSFVKEEQVVKAV